MFGIDASLYRPIFLFVFMTMGFVQSIKMMKSDGCDFVFKPADRRVTTIIYIVSIILALFLGARNVRSSYFVDSVLYAQLYGYKIQSSEIFSGSMEYGWTFLNYICQKYGLTANEFFTIIDIGYYLLYAIAIKRLFKYGIWIAFLFFILSFSTYSYSINGIRNGLAAAISICGITYLIDEKKTLKILGVFLLLISTTIHSSMTLPALCACAALFIHNYKVSLYIWIAAVFLSAIFGNYFAYLLEALGYDDRLTHYLRTGEKLMEQGFAKSGFRLDFILYSAAPIFLSWYLLIRYNVQNRIFLFLANTYTLSNAVWVLIIRAAYSNRFAYLSWYIYPIILAYPLLSIRIWRDQDKKVGIILLIYMMFNFI